MIYADEIKPFAYARSKESQHFPAFFVCGGRTGKDIMICTPKETGAKLPVENATEAGYV